MFLLGGATTGLWLASTGLIRLERSFVLSLAGSCSFCAKRRNEVHALVGTAGHAEKICDECVGLCCEILADEVGVPTSREPHASVAPSLEDEQFQQHVGAILERIAAEREAARQDLLLDQLRHSLKPERRLDLDAYRCTFCGAHRREVVKLVSGPRVFICDTCVGEATALVTHVLRRA